MEKDPKKHKKRKKQKKKKKKKKTKKDTAATYYIKHISIQKFKDNDNIIDGHRASFKYKPACANIEMSRLIEQDKIVELATKLHLIFYPSNLPNCFYYYAILQAQCNQTLRFKLFAKDQDGIKTIGKARVAPAVFIIAADGLNLYKNIDLIKTHPEKELVKNIFRCSLSILTFLHRDATPKEMFIQANILTMVQSLLNENTFSKLDEKSALYDLQNYLTGKRPRPLNDHYKFQTKKHQPNHNSIELA